VYDPAIKTVEIKKATGPLSDYAQNMGKEAGIPTDEMRPRLGLKESEASD
jgi:hypothetical protein